MPRFKCCFCGKQKSGDKRTRPSEDKIYIGVTLPNEEGCCRGCLRENEDAVPSAESPAARNSRGAGRGQRVAVSDTPPLGSARATQPTPLPPLLGLSVAALVVLSGACGARHQTQTQPRSPWAPNAPLPTCVVCPGGRQ